jgi:acetoin utilization deacetylase AcuC-like enzyme
MSKETPLISFSSRYLYRLPDTHRFPIDKYTLIKDQLLYDGTITASQLVDPGLATLEQLALVHDEFYCQQVINLTLPQKAVRKIGLPINEKSVNRALNSIACTLHATGQALQHGLGIHIGGGTHHGYREHGEGFSIFNDQAVGAAYLLASRTVERILIVDLDVHQGNGTARIFKDNKAVFTFSMHGEKNYPLHKEQSDLDVALPNRTDDNPYLEKLQDHLPEIIRSFQPHFIFYQSGVDILEGDRLGKLAVSKWGCLERDRMVINASRSNGIPLVITMGGGYNRSMANLVDAHCNTIRYALGEYT